MKLNREMFNQKTLNTYDGALKSMIDNIEIPEMAKTLEIGCSESEMSCILQKLGYEAWGVDFNDWALKWGDLNFKFIKGNFQSVELPENYFDVVIDICALHHFGIGGYGEEKDLEADIKSSYKIYSCLKKGGVFYSSFDRFSEYFVEQSEGFFRQYNLEQFQKRVCEGKFKIEVYKYYKHSWDKATEYHEIELTQNITEAKILFVKMRKIGE
jgi:ubiquinone/menaquinone biosynthesis C-methylase UbiE